MVSSVCRGVCNNMSPKSNVRVLSIDRNKDYSLPLQVETSVEYDLPSHIYPPKGSEPILMLHPSYSTPVRARKVPVTSHSQPVSKDSRALMSLQMNRNQQLSKSASKISQTRNLCSCGAINCPQSSSFRAPNLKNSEEYSSVISKSSTQTTENIVYSSVKVSSQSTDMKLHQKQMQQKVSLQKQIQHQKQFQLQQQHLQRVQLQLHEQVKLQAQQLHHLQTQQLKTPQTSMPPRQPSSADHLLMGRCQQYCCQPRPGALPPSQAEFLAPGLPPSLFSRTPTRGTSGGSPKLRARTRRGLSVAGTVNLPEYLGGSVRSSRTNTTGGIAVGSSHAHSRSRSSSMLAATPAPITAHQVQSALEVVRAHVLTPRSLFSSSQQQQQIQSNPSSMMSSTAIGQCRDSGCSLSSETNTTSNGFPSSENGSVNNMDFSFGVVDSGFCTPVDSHEDQIMESYDAFGSPFGSYTPVTPATVSSTQQQLSSKESSNLQWMTEFSSPLSSSTSNGFHNSFIQSSNPQYIPQPIWNLAY